MFEHDRDGARSLARGRLHADRHAAIGGDRHVDRHLDAAQRAPQHHALAVQLDDAHALVGSLVAGRETDREGKGVEPLDAARPGRREPANGCLTPQILHSPPGEPRFVFAPPKVCPRSLPQTCRKGFGIRLMFLVNPRYRRHKRRRMLDGSLLHVVNFSLYTPSTTRPSVLERLMSSLLDQSALTDLAERLVAAARAAGADAADAVAVRSVSLAVEVREGAVEESERSEGDDVGLRVFVGQRQAVVSTNDVTADADAARRARGRHGAGRARRSVRGPCRSGAACARPSRSRSARLRPARRSRCWSGAPATPRRPGSRSRA